MIYTPIENMNDGKQHLLDVFNQHKETDLHQYKIKNVNQEILGTRDYYEMYFSFKRGKKFFYDLFPYECRGYQYVYMPPNYSMVVHKDISYLKCRLGIMLQGSAPILFYDEDHETLINSYDYEKPVLTDVQVPHNVKNNDEYRLTFFINFEQEYDNILGQMTNENI